MGFELVRVEELTTDHEKFGVMTWIVVWVRGRLVAEFAKMG